MAHRLNKDMLSADVIGIRDEAVLLIFIALMFVMLSGWLIVQLGSGEYPRGWFWVGALIALVVGGGGLIGLVMLPSVIKDTVRDLRDGSIDLAFRVRRKWLKEVPVYSEFANRAELYFVQAEEASSALREFQVTANIYNEVREGDEIVVSYYPRRQTIARVRVRRG